jgi:hypothetical protein
VKRRNAKLAVPQVDRVSSHARIVVDHLLA